MQMSCAPFSSLSLGSGLYFFRPQSPRKNTHSLLRYFGIRGICITSLPAPVFVGLLLKIEKRPTSPETVRFQGDFGRFCLIAKQIALMQRQSRHFLPVIAASVLQMGITATPQAPKLPPVHSCHPAARGKPQSRPARQESYQCCRRYHKADLLLRKHYLRIVV